MDDEHRQALIVSQSAAKVAVDLLSTLDEPGFTDWLGLHEDVFKQIFKVANEHAPAPAPVIQPQSPPPPPQQHNGGGTTVERAADFLRGYSGNHQFLVDVKSKTVDAGRLPSEKQAAAVLRFQ